MQRAVAFCSTIKDSKNLSGDDDTKKHVENTGFKKVIEDYYKNSGESLGVKVEDVLNCSCMHVDGKMNSMERQEKLRWLKDENIEKNECRILFNARCLSEGVDVPTLDAVIFMQPRKSNIDIIQAVGRVMRRAENKDWGYIILPIVVKAGVKPEDALNDNEAYSVVWDVLRALRSIDERLDITINSVEFKKNLAKHVDVIGIPGKELVENQEQFVLNFGNVAEYKDAIYAKIVQKCGDRIYWEKWANDVSDIAEKNILRINGLIDKNIEAREVFNTFLLGLHKNINSDIGRDEAIEMLAQHMITKPIFNAIFMDYDFAANNVISKEMQHIIDILEKNNLESENKSLATFYDSITKRVRNIDTVEAKQKIIIDLYDKFFKTAFPKMAERLGIVYTPVEVVDFIINSVEDVLRDEFKTSLSNKNVNILDPFTGTGTFITRLLQSGLIKKEDLKYKYENEIHANEIVLLAYYIASINIETVYHYLVNEERYSEFKGMVLTDTFNMNENDDRLDSSLKENSARITKQKNIKIQVIMGNPPYSAGQKNENDNNKNIKYPKLDKNIADSYVVKSVATRKYLYDSYIRAIRWSSDRLKNGDKGVVAFVTNGSFIDGNAFDGLRKCLVEEFDKIYCFNLRGNFRKFDKKEGENVFGNAAGTTIAITILVKNSKKNSEVDGDVFLDCRNGKIYYYEIGDSLKTAEKLAKIAEYRSIKNINFKEIEPNSKGDWLNIRNNMEYEEGKDFIVLGDKNNKTVKGNGKGKVIFNNYSLGIVTARDGWVYNFSKDNLKENMERMIGFYNSEVKRLGIYCNDMNKKVSALNDKEVDGFVNSDSTKISWAVNLKSDFKRFKKHGFKDEAIRTSMYRPFCKQYLYYGKDFNERTYQIPKLMPTDIHKNMLIGVRGKGANTNFNCLMVNEMPDLELVSKAQWFGFYNYEYVGSGGSVGDLNGGNGGDLLFGAGGGGSAGGIIDDGGVLEGEYIRRDNISNSILNEFKEVYKDINITKEDIFYYVYGILNSKEYVDTYRDYIEKEIPKIPFVESFWEFSLLGKELANLHLNYEELDEWRGDGFIESAIESGGENFYKVSKMKFLDKKTKDTIIYNENITIKNIPQKAYEYKVNGKSAIEWVMDRYCFDIDKKTKIVNDCNLYDGEGGKYIYTLLLKIINLSISSVDIINNLPSLKIIKKDK
jgi:predicted helicase